MKFIFKSKGFFIEWRILIKKIILIKIIFEFFLNIIIILVLYLLFL